MKATKLSFVALYLIGVLGTVGLPGDAPANVVLNGSFEEPPITNTPLPTWQLFPQASVPGWGTNDPSGQIEYWYTGFNGVPAVAGTQFTELDANALNTMTQAITGIVPGSALTFAFSHRGRSGTDTVRFRLSSGVNQIFTQDYSTGNTAWVQYSNPVLPAIKATDAAGSLTVAFQAMSSTGGASFGNFLDAIQVEASACRILRLKSAGPVPQKNTTAPAVPMFGTGAFTGSAIGSGAVTQYDTLIKTNEGMFTGKGLIYNDGDFTPGYWPGEDFPTQAPSPFPAGVVLPAAAYGDFNLNGLVLTSTVGGTITFGSSGTYSYVGGTFANHGGTYRTLDCAAAVPEPPTLLLMLLPLMGWVFARRRTSRWNKIGLVPMGAGDDRIGGVSGAC